MPSADKREIYVWQECIIIVTKKFVCVRVIVVGVYGIFYFVNFHLSNADKFLCSIVFVTNSTWWKCKDEIQYIIQSFCENIRLQQECDPVGV